MEMADCPNCGALNPDGHPYCGMCGSMMPDQLPKPKRSEWYYGAIAIAIAIGAMIIFYGVFFLITWSPPYIPSATIGTVKGTTATSYVWTITAISGAGSVLKDDIYVQLRNASGFVIISEPLVTASGSHGFSYASASAGSSISVGDVLSLSKAYSQGSTITLVNAGATRQYCVLTV